MTLRPLIAGAALIAFANTAPAQEVSGRLHLVRGDCRFELTIGKSIRRDGEWRAVSVAPFVKANQPGTGIQLRKRDPDLSK